MRSDFKLTAIAVGTALLLLFFAPFRIEKTSAQTTALATLAASMPQGSWAELPTSNTGATLGNTNGSVGMILGYSDDAVWDPVSKQLFFVGGDHNQIPCYPRFVSYADSTNAWQVLPQPSWFPCTYPMHGYHHTAIDAANGKLYHRPFSQTVVQKYDIASQTWTSLPAIPSNVLGNISCCAGVAWFPERNSLIYTSLESGTNGAVVEYRESTGQWLRIAGNLPMGSYHNIALYNPVFNVVLFGGGNGDNHLYKLDSAGQVTALKPAPILIGIEQSIVTVDPVSGKYLVAGNSNNFYVYDVVADMWDLQTGALPIFTGSHYTPAVFGIVAAPLSTYGVTMFVKCYTNDCHVYLYKHYADTTTPTVSVSSPTDSSIVSGTISVSADASDNAGVVGVQFKLDGYNLGAEDTSPPYSVSWDTTTAINTSHTLAAVARDAAGNHKTSTVSVTVNNAIPFAFSLSAEGDKTVTQGQSVSTTIKATSTAGTILPVFFLVSGLPSETTSSFSASSCTPNPSCTSTLTLSTSTSTPTGSYPIVVTGTAGLSNTTPFTLNVYEVNASFADKCAQSSVLSCFSFDNSSSLFYNWPTGTVCDNSFAGQTNYSIGSSRIGPGNASAIVQNGQCMFPEIDTTTSHTGSGALKFTIPPNSGPNSSGYFTEVFKRNSDGTFPYIGPGSPLGNVFYFQFYQKFDSNFLSTDFQCIGGTCSGWKQAIWYGNPPNGTSSSSIESTMINGFQRGLPQMYGQQGSDDYGIQNIIGCTFVKATSAGGAGSGFLSQPNYSAPLNPTCIHYVADQWMEFTGRIEIRGASNAPASRVQLWINGLPAIDYGAARVNWTGADGTGFGQFMLTPYHTNKDLNQVHPIGTTWYDDVIVSTQPIPMLNGVIPMADTTPPSVTNVAASNITSNGATITWTSSEPANSQVEYGLTASYGIQSSLDTSLVTSHSATLSDLLPGTVYTYRARSSDISGNVATSDGLTFTTAAGASNASPLTNGLTGYWALDEGSGTTTADLSGNNNNGTLINNPLWITGKVSKALQFNATDNNNDTDDPRVWIGRNFDVPGFPFTMSAWVNPTNFTDYRAIFSKRDSDSTSAKRLDLGLSIGTGRVYINSSTPRSFIYAPPTNTWTHFAVVASSTDTKLYVNGALQETIAAFTLGTGANANTAIGGTGEVLTGDDDPFKGSIDEVRVYNRALTPSEIQLARDANAPVISGVNTSNITAFGAAVTWTTDERADSQVDYGTTSSYGQSTPLDTSLLTGHGLNLSGLSSSTTYHFRVKSKDAARNLATSQDYTFTTAAPPVITLSPATLPDPTAGVAYNQTITASGGFSPYAFGVLTGSLPAGLTLNASTGTITGTPTTAGAASFTIQAVDSLGYTGNRSYTVNTANLISDNVYLTLTSRTYDSEPSTDPPLVGRLSLSFNMTNIGPAITSPMYFIVTDLYKLFGDQNPDQPDLLLSADNHAGKMGDRQTLTIGPLQTNQTAPVSFLVGIGSRQPFEFYVDLYTSADGSPLIASDSGILKATTNNALGTLLGRFKFTVSEAAPTQTVPPGPFVSVPPGSNAGAAGNVGVIIGPGPQSRPSVAVDPVLSEHMAVASNDYAARTVRISTTPDGGATWYSTMLGRTLGNQTFFAAQNPSLAFDSLGRLSVVYSLSNLNDSSNAIVISESSDGINFNPPAAISFHLASEQVIDSRPVVAIKSGAGRYVAWDSLTLATSRYGINLVRSEEGGLFGPVTTVVNNDLVSSVALALNKSRVYIGWDNWGFNSVAPYKTGGSLMVTSSPNGPQLNFAAPQELARTTIGSGQRIPAMPEKGVRPNLSLAADPKDDSRVYAVFTDRGNGMDVRLGGSADQGKTWQVVTVSNDDTLADQFDPAIELDSNSNPYISFYDTRLSSTFEAADLFLATLSTGNSFDAQRLSSVSSNDSQKNPQRDFIANLGDRTALAITPDKVIVAWTDTRLNSEDIFLNVVTGIAQQIPSVTWSNPAPTIYGTALSAAQLNAYTPVAGTFAYNPPAGTFPDAGVYTLSVTFTPSDAYRFTSTTAAVQISVLPAPLSVTATSVSRFYGSPTPPPTGTLAGVVNGDNVTATYMVSATTNNAPGTYPITPVISDPNKRLLNYSVKLTSGVLEIRPAPLTITANSASRLYSAANPVLTGSIVGPVTPDDITARYTTSATMKSSVGKYTITPVVSDPGNRLSNYTVNAINGSLEVLPAPVAVTANSGSRFYASPNPELTGSITGVVNADNIRASYATLATINSLPGNYAISPTIIDPDHRLPNYNVTLNSGLLTVVPAPIITLTATNPDSEDDSQRSTGRASGTQNLRVSFGDQELLSASKAVTVTVGNIGTADLIISGLAVEGAGASDFELANKCGKTVAAGSNCTFTVKFTPSTLGKRASGIRLTDNSGGYPGSDQTINSSGNGVLSYAVYATSTACEAIAFSDNASTDSFDSSRGSYAETKSNKRGDIAVNGNATLSERATVNGAVYSLTPTAGACKGGKPGISVSGRAEATGGYRLLEAPVAFTTPPTVTPGTSDVKAKNDTPLRPGKYSDITVDGRARLILSPGTYDINSLKLSGGGKITVAGEGQVILNIAGIDTDKPLQLSGESMVNPSGNPANFLLRYAGRAQLDLGGQVDSYGVIYAPNAAVKLGGKADWYGALVVKTLESAGRGGLHYDRDLGR